MPVNTEVKGTLARLLATENLKIEHRKVDTACFDVENRVLVLPIWKAASTDVYDMLVGHEVGHALYTPADEYDAPRDFVNVLEDARIERMMKVTYPGLKHSFFKGYTELWENNFFGVKNKDLTKISFIDRINLYFKGCAQVEFSEYEQSIVDRAAVTKTFQDVIDLAREVYDYAEKTEAEKDKEEELPDMDFDFDDESFEPQQSNVVSPQSQEREERPDLGDDDTEYEEDEVEEPIGGDAGDVDETRSVTDKAFKDNLEDMVDDDAKEWVYLNLPKVKLSDVVEPWEKIQEDLEYFFYGQAFQDERQQEKHNESLQYCLNKYEDYKSSAQKSVTYLVKQFEMKKSADQYARASTAKTGVIDTNKLFSYKINEDIFKKVTVVPDGKNHGLVMLLDWSGSMQHTLMDTLKQTYNLIWFCKKVNIPFRVYAFQSGFGREWGEFLDTQKNNDLAIQDDFRLLEFFSSRMNKQKLEKQLRLVWSQAWSMGEWSYVGYHRDLSLGGTPLAEATLYMREAVKEMRKVEKVQKVNVICLTDGEANPISFVADRRGDGSKSCNYLCHTRRTVFILRDPVTGYTRKISNSPYETTKEIVSFMSEITDYNWIGIRICSKNELNRCISGDVTIQEREKIQKTWNKEKFASIEKKHGFSKAFYIPNKGIGQGTTDLTVKQRGESATRGELTRAFKKHMGSKMTNKTILNAFIEQIA
jgi:hypothetical protein